MGWELLFVLFTIGLVLWITVARRRRVLSERRHQAAVERLGEAIIRTGGSLELVSTNRGEVRLGRGETSLAFPLTRIESLDSLEPLLAGAEFLLDRRAEALKEPLELRKHGVDLGPLLVPCGWLAAFPDGAMTPHTQLGDTAWCAIYRFLSTDHLVFLDARSLESIGLDVDGLHGAMMALLSQRFDEERVERLLSGEPRVDLRDDQELSSSFLFLIPELLPEGSELWAQSSQPGRLLLSVDPGELPDPEEAEETALSIARLRLHSNGVESG